MKSRHILLLGLAVACGLRYFGNVKAATAEPMPKLGYYTGGLKPWGDLKGQDFKQSIELSGSRGETLNFTLHAGPGECIEPKVLNLPPTETRFFEILPFFTKNASYRGAKPGVYWDAVLPRAKICPTGDGAWILGEIRIPKNAQPGTYSGSLVAGKSKPPLHLKIWSMTIPEQPSIPLYSELTTWFLLLGHYGKWHEGEAELARKYEASMIDHRIVPLKHWIRPLEAGNGPTDLRRVNGAEASDSFYSAAVKPLPDWAKISVPLDSNLKAEDPKTPDTIAKLSEALNREGWLKRSFAYLWDEPAKADMPALKRLAALVRKQAPGLKILVTTTPEKELEDLIDIYAPIMDAYDLPGENPPPARYTELQKKGKEVWLYASCVSHGCGNDVDSGAPDWVIDRPGTHIRSQGWLAQRYGLNGLLYYSVDNGYQFFAKGRDPWKDLWDFSGNGDGTLYYPGRPGLFGLTAQVPVETLRLKLWRQSSYDADYAKMMNGATVRPDWWPKRLNALIRSPHDWEHADSVYRELREQIGDYLDKTKGI